MPTFELDGNEVAKVMSILSEALSKLEPLDVDAVAVQAAIGACYVLNVRFTQSKHSWEYAVEIAEKFVGKENLENLAESYDTTTH
jgi:hypothetical protein